MSICSANMKECNKKKKCLYGPNAGKAYDPKNPCCGFGEFDASTCDCNDGIGFDSLQAIWAIQYGGTGVYSGSNGQWVEPAWYNGQMVWDISSGSGRNKIYLNSAAFVTTTCCAPAPSTYGDSSGVFWVNYDLSSSSTSLEDPVHRENCFWPEDCGYCSYTYPEPGEAVGSRGCLTWNTYGRLTGIRYVPDPDDPGGYVRQQYLLFDNIPPDSPRYPGVPGDDVIVTKSRVTAFANGDCICAFGENASGG